jgi:3-oxoadipate enol-lactonase
LSAVEVHHEISGPAGAPVVVLSNSLGTTLAMWDPQVEVLSERFRVVRYDQRGHGRSPAPPGPYSIAEIAGDVLALLDRLELERVSLCGVSLGGMVGMWAASEAPQRFHRLVLACTAAQLGPRELWDERVAAVRAGGTSELAAGAIDRWLTPEFSATHPETAQWLQAMIVQASDEGYAACCEAIRDLDLRNRLRSIEAPTLVISGDEDPATPPEHQRLIADGIPGARLQALENARHLANVEKPDTFNRAIVDHLSA